MMEHVRILCLKMYSEVQQTVMESLWISTLLGTVSDQWLQMLPTLRECAVWLGQCCPMCAFAKAPQARSLITLVSVNSAQLAQSYVAALAVHKQIREMFPYDPECGKTGTVWMQHLCFTLDDWQWEKGLLYFALVQSRSCVWQTDQDWTACWQS